jgi:hypothetical protein
MRYRPFTSVLNLVLGSPTGKSTYYAAAEMPAP